MNFIDIISFLRDFYGIYSSSLKYGKLRHCDVKELFPFIKECPINKANIDDIIHGDIIGVYDKSNTIVYYYNPHLCNIDNFIDEDDVTEEKKYCLNKDISLLSKDELLKLRSKLRKNGNREDAYKVTKQIKKIKNKDLKNYYKKKEKMLIKESFYD